MWRSLSVSSGGKSSRTGAFQNDTDLVVSSASTKFTGNTTHPCHHLSSAKFGSMKPSHSVSVFILPSEAVVPSNLLPLGFSRQESGRLLSPATFSHLHPHPHQYSRIYIRFSKKKICSQASQCYFVSPDSASLSEQVQDMCSMTGSWPRSHSSSLYTGPHVWPGVLPNI